MRSESKAAGEDEPRAGRGSVLRIGPVWDLAGPASRSACQRCDSRSRLRAPDRVAGAPPEAPSAIPDRSRLGSSFGRLRMPSRRTTTRAVRVLLDESVPRRLRQELPGHEVSTIRDVGWAGLTNGLLLARAGGRFEVLITVDQNIQHQQRLPVPGLAILIVRAATNDIDALRPLMAEVRSILATVKGAEIRLVGG